MDNSNLTDLKEKLHIDKPFWLEDEHIIREYFQKIIIKHLYASKKWFVDRLAFIGWTALRLLYHTWRYSEDLDFSLYNYTEKDLDDIVSVLKELENLYSSISLKAEVKDKTAVFKLFIKIGDLRGLWFQQVTRDKNVKIKFEFDTNPPSIENNVLEKLDLEGVPITVHSKRLLKSWKLSAVLFRTYIKGRDYYDLDLYLNDNRFKDVLFDSKYITNNIAQQNLETNSVSDEDVRKILKERIDALEDEVVFWKVFNDVKNFVFWNEKEKVFNTLKENLKKGYNNYYK